MSPCVLLHQLSARPPRQLIPGSCRAESYREPQSKTCFWAPETRGGIKIRLLHVTRHISHRPELLLSPLQYNESHRPAVLPRGTCLFPPPRVPPKMNSQSIRVSLDKIRVANYLVMGTGMCRSLVSESAPALRGTFKDQQHCMAVFNVHS